MSFFDLANVWFRIKNDQKWQFQVCLTSFEHDNFHKNWSSLVEIIIFQDIFSKMYRFEKCILEGVGSFKKHGM